MLKGLGRGAEGDRVRLPVVANSQDMVVLGDRVAAALEPGVPTVLVARHGLYTWGADLDQARHHAEIVVWLLELVNAGGAATTSAEHCSLLGLPGAGASPGARTWDGLTTAMRQR